MLMPLSIHFQVTLWLSHVPAKSHKPPGLDAFVLCQIPSQIPDSHNSWWFCYKDPGWRSKLLALWNVQCGDGVSPVTLLYAFQSLPLFADLALPLGIGYEWPLLMSSSHSHQCPFFSYDVGLASCGMGQAIACTVVSTKLQMIFTTVLSSQAQKCKRDGIQTRKASIQSLRMATQHSGMLSSVTRRWHGFALSA